MEYAGNMKILLANKFYYPRGGDCIYSLNLEKLLIDKGHDVAFFSQNYEENLHNDYLKYWPSNVDYSKKSFSNLKELLVRPIYSTEVKEKFICFIKDFRPDVIHLNNVHSQLSPILAQIGFNFNIKVVWTLHDMKLICPAYSCYRNDEICELCFNNKKFNVIKHKCVKNLIGSSIAYIEAKRWNLKKLEKYTDKFISPSSFLKDKLVSTGLSQDKISVLNNFIDKSKILSSPSEKNDYCVYFGRISNEKGIKVLLKAAEKLKYKVKIIGTGPLLNELKEKYTHAHIEFLGFLEWDKLKNIISKAQFSIVPSICYENNPLSIIESFSLGTPVLGANIGGIPELINKNSGLVFEPNDSEDLENKMNYFIDELTSKNLGKYTIEEARNNFCSDKYYSNLMKIYTF